MLLKYSGWDGVPDDITEEWGNDFAQDPENLGYLFNVISTDHFLRTALNTTVDGTLKSFRSTVDAGFILIVHGYFTNHGHVLVVTGRNSDGDYIVNDPAGVWTERFRGGYEPSESDDGKGIVYQKEYFEAAVSTSDGAGFMPLQYHTLVEF